ncbi:hypothetical protein TCAL_07644 [Tigriopus californicus]|uniref:Peroxisomal multifunctional enzyme type 2 n=2 Tax=Tigriopus californicus TaxID=6832 RepID=A0A553NNY3_TIGCA|nr:hypothetical protein TCAL_07644 [Tigriopus californicus]|eukprot:TCALIF_07644-PB protein Name:"Similar to HSD17B4 Peroxisomal multifunctional enzyme type 2 (Homo sapiens)" AED:0.09 eAED:0.09 QI:219/1/1/1/0.75/0.61/13/88/741
MSIRFDNRVAVVTGAGGGLGKAYALLLASRGASVVVNDLGGSRSGEGQSSKAADEVVSEIRNKGGKAVANYDSVENGEAVIKTALDNFGRIDIVINNAGILRDRSIARTADSDWDLVHRVHLRGAFQVTRAAWPHMKKQKYGRIVNTSSVAGIFGNFGQANYSAAKAGLLGFTNTLAIEGERSGIQANIIVPMAASRLTQDILPPELFDGLKPELIAPVVAWMCHEDCPDTGSIIEAAGGWAGKYRWQRSQGTLLMDDLSENITPERVRERWAQIVDMQGGDFPTSNQGATMDLVGKMEKLTSSPDSTQIQGDLMSAIGFKSQPFLYNFDHRDVILYALAVGASTENHHGLKYLYEGNPNFSALPSFGVMPGFGSFVGLINGDVPGLEIDLSKVLHGEQYTEMVSTRLPTEGSLESTFQIQAILDKGSGAVLLVEVLTKDQVTQETIVKNQMSVFVVGSGGFNGPRSSEHLIPTEKNPSHAPDWEMTYQTNIDQAALYRLCGDANPLHIDPSFSGISGFKKPILHGLCSYGIAARQIVDEVCQGDPGRVKAIKARFAKPVIPGQTLVTKAWKINNEKISFSCVVKETGQECLNGGWIILRSYQDDKQSDDGGGRKQSPDMEQKLGTTLKSDVVFQAMERRLKAKPDMVNKVRAVFHWIITNSQGKPASHWTVDLKNTPGSITQGAHGTPDCTLTIFDDDMVQMVEGNLKPQTAFMKGKLKVKGNIMLTQKLQDLIGDHSKL